MASLREFEKKKEEEMEMLEVRMHGMCEEKLWYEEAVSMIENKFTVQLDQYEKELEVGIVREDKQ